MSNKKNDSEETMKSRAARTKKFLDQKKVMKQERDVCDCISTCARAALRLAEVVQEVFQARADVAKMVRATMDQVVAGCSLVASGKVLPTEGPLTLTEEVCQAAVSDTRKARVALRLFQEQVRALDESYLRAKGSDPIAAFRALREVSREFSDTPDVAAGTSIVYGELASMVRAEGTYGKRQSLWQYVLRAWDTLDPEAARIARWPPGKGAREEFKFDEATRSWRHVVSDESIAAEATVEVKSTFAVAK